jgi:hypothetical protein
VSKTVTLVVYDPPKADLPFLAVAVYPDGRVQGVAADTAAQAQQLLNQVAAEVEKQNPGSVRDDRGT